MSEERDEGGQREDFDGRLARLEAVVEELEEGGLGLEGALERYREGVGLLKGCRTALEAYQQQVEELAADAELTLRPFDGAPDDADRG
ncbi:MAG: exodeoxyribonuclease VII small subunit [Planctomycetota bacterium]|jgi:exodeoxyribonuclease VII small subunit|nr:exodeoxyribonuclease VII small subunit [Planctomycetota bacterium]MDP6989563.1 exodeoxyribonuclease VII small subunit [Planctomycetota bacterium]